MIFFLLTIEMIRSDLRQFLLMAWIHVSNGIGMKLMIDLNSD